MPLWRPYRAALRWRLEHVRAVLGRPEALGPAGLLAALEAEAQLEGMLAAAGCFT